MRDSNRSRVKTADQLRSQRWFGGEDVRAFGHRSRAKQMGYALEDFQGKPVIAIINTWSDLTTCHSHFRARADEVKRGVWQAGGFPVERVHGDLRFYVLEPFHINSVTHNVE